MLEKLKAEQNLNSFKSKEEELENIIVSTREELREKEKLIKLKDKE